jgi:hypothetical protein
MLRAGFMKSMQGGGLSGGLVCSLDILKLVPILLRTLEKVSPLDYNGFCCAG